MAATGAGRPSRGRPPRIRLEDVVDAACRLGLEGLTVVAVANQLGVRDSAIYRYVDSREELLHLVADRALDDFDADFDPTADLEELLVEFGQRIRHFLAKYQGMADYCTRFGERPPVRRLAERVYEAVVDRELHPVEAVVAVDAVSSYVFAHAQASPIGIRADPVPVDPAELSPIHAEGRAVADALDPDEYFGWLLGVLVSGLVVGVRADDAPWR
mgnify:CR=1 FL=1